MQVSRAVVDRLAAHGIEAVFGIPGTQTLPLNEAVDDREDVRFVMARHETAVTHQAWGYAETTGRPAATLVVPGPGDLNAANGLKNAHNDCTPLIHLAVETDPELRGGDGIHETPPETYDPLVDANLLVERPAATVAVLESAIATALEPPMGPVRVGIPKGFLTRDVPMATPSARDSASSDAAATGAEFDTPPSDASSTGGEPRVRAADDEIGEAAARLSAADEPVVLAGGGVRAADASDALERVATRLDAPVVTTYKGKGVLPERHPLSAGVLAGSAPPALLELLAGSDAALAVGTDFDAVATRAWSVDLPAELVHVTLDPDDLATGYEPTVPIVADARRLLAALDTALTERGVDRPSPTEESATDGAAPADEAAVTDELAPTGDDGASGATPGRRRAAAVRDDFRERVAPLFEDEPPLSSVAALAAVREAVPEETTLALDAGGFRVWALNALPAAGPRAYVNPGSWATMGTGLPSAIGAQVAEPDRPVVALTGDGGLLMCVHELHTVAAEALPVTVVVFVNEDYAIISDEADRRFEIDDGYGWTDAPIDVVALAESLGVRGERAETPAEIRETVGDAVDADKPVVVAVRTDPDEPQASDWFSS